MRYELSDCEWSVIMSMLPNKPRGVPRVNDRRVLNGIFWVLRSGAPWRDLPETDGPCTTCYNRFVRWRRTGVWDQIMVGTGTVVADDPQLTCRLPGLDHRSPVRVVIDRHLRIPPAARLITDARRIPTWLLTLRSADPARRASFVAKGVTLIDVDADREGQVDLAVALTALGERGITRLLVEGGAGLAAAFFRARLVDRLVWVHAPLALGGDGIPAIAGLDLAALSDAPAFERLSTETNGEDVLTTFRVRPV